MEAAPASQAWLERYLGELATQRRLSPHTIAAYRRDLRELDALAGAPSWDSVNHADVRRFAAQLHGKGQSPRSVARKLSSWRGFFDWLSQHTALAANPVAGVRAPRRAASLPKALSVDCAVQLVGAGPLLRDHPEPFELCNRAMFELMYSSGLRVSELAGLDVAWSKAGSSAAPGQPGPLGWLDLDAGEVLVTGKGNKMRRVPVGSHAAAALQAWLAVRPPARDGGNALFLSMRATAGAEPAAAGGPALRAGSTVGPSARAAPRRPPAG
jgi:integrase/recombinase XerC